MRIRTFAAVWALSLIVLLAGLGEGLADDTTYRPAETKREARRLAKVLKKRLKKSLRASKKAFARNRKSELRDLFLPPGVEDLASSRPITYDRSEGEPGRTHLDGYQLVLSEIGGSYLRSRDAENMFELYSSLFDWVPEKFLEGLPGPEEVRSLGKAKLRKAFRLVAGRFIRDIDLIRPEISITTVIEDGLQFIGACDLEVGYEGGNEIADRCAFLDYAAGGLMRNADFALKDDLTCVKDQGGRGTCAAHAINATVETEVMASGGPASNLSEQHTYFRAKITVNWSTRYTDGLDTGQVLEDFEDDGYRIQYESLWQYNPSMSRGAFDAGTNTFPSSCVGYTGEKCSDFAFQADEIVTPIGPVNLYEYVFPAPSPTDGHVITSVTDIPDYTWIGLPDFQLDLVIVAVESGKPVVGRVNVPPSFRSPDANGYILDSGGTSSGGHAVEIVGFVASADLPAAAPADPDGRGFFIIKNSWGLGWADCGFGYVSHDWLRRWGYGYYYLDVS